MLVEAQRHLKQAMILMAKIQEAMGSPEETPKDPAPDLDRKMWMLIHSDKWPVAIEPRHLCDSNSDEDKMTRANAILDQVVDVDLYGLKFLDYGCGEGHVAFAAAKTASVSVGYDLYKMGWDIFPETHNLILTTDPSDYGPFDVILLHDVLDHVKDPLSVLEHARSLLDNRGRICVFCHPWCSKTGGHNYRDTNRAYAQLFFPEEEGQKVYRPFEEYKDWFDDAGLVVKHERPSFNEIPKILHVQTLAERLKAIYGEDKFPEEHLRVSNIVYSLSKEL